MALMPNLNFKKKLLLAFSLMALLVLLTGLSGHYATRQITGNLQTLYDDRFDHIIELSEMIREMAQLRAVAYRLAITNDAQTQDRLQQEMQHGVQRIQVLIGLCDDHCVRTGNLAAFAPVQKGWEDFSSSVKPFLAASRPTDLERLHPLLQNLEQSYKTLDTAAWNMAMGQDRLGRQLYQQSMEAADRAAVISALLLLLAIFGTAGLAYAMSRHLANPIRQLAKNLNQIGQGDLSLATPTQLQQRSDEIGLLATGIETTRQDLSQLVNNILQITTQLSESTQALQQVCGENAIQMQQQRHDTDQVAAAMEQMMHSVEEVASSALSAAEAAHATDQEAEQGQQKIAQLDHSLQTLNTAIQQTSQVIGRVENNANSIETALKVIDEIAEQTNLLALNAAIESARAGEAGRGFAVVADEVRNLSKRTQDSTRQIEGVIRDLQQSVSESVHTMQNGHEQALQVIQQAEATRKSLSIISSAVTRLDGVNAQIASATHQQSSATLQVGQNLASIRTVTEHSEIIAEQINQTSLQLAQLSETLRQDASHFRL